MSLLNLLILILLVLLSGLFSGLTLGLLGLDKTELERKIKIGNKKAKKIYKIRKRGNLLLCTLLIGNVAVNSTIAIILGNITGGLIAGISSTALIVIFGEIVPQAVTSRYALTIGSKTVWVVQLFIFILYPICWPLSKILDKFLGEEMPTVWSRKELAEIIKHHEDSDASNLDSDEERILLGALSFSDKSAKEIMTPLSVIFMFEENEKLTPNILKKIRNSGFTRIPIYRRQKDNIVSILYAKKLIGLKKVKTIKSFIKKSKILEVYEDTTLDDLLNKLIKQKIHIAVIYDKDHVLLGIVTLEDIIEEVFKREIVDEDDKVVDLQKMAKQKAEKSKKI